MMSMDMVQMQQPIGMVMNETPVLTVHRLKRCFHAWDATVHNVALSCQ
jgi:hypothetical protein